MNSWLVAACTHLAKAPKQIFCEAFLICVQCGVGGHRDKPLVLHSSSTDCILCLAAAEPVGWSAQVRFGNLLPKQHTLASFAFNLGHGICRCVFSYGFEPAYIMIFVQSVCVCKIVLYSINVQRPAKKHVAPWSEASIHQGLAQNPRTAASGLDIVTQSQSPAATSKGNNGRLRAMNLPKITKCQGEP